MLGIFKKFWSRSETDTVFAPPADSKPPVPVTVTTRSGGTAAGSRPTTIPRPAVPPSRLPAVKASVRPATLNSALHPTRPGCVNVTLGAIEPSLPEPLRHKIAGALHEMVPVPLEQVVPQLQRGSVALTVRQLRICAPELLASLNGHDDIAIALPLSEIVPQLDKACFNRREPLKRWQVPDEVGSIFTPTSDGAAVAINTQLGDATPKAPAAQAPKPLAAKPDSIVPKPVATPKPATAAPVPAPRVAPTAIAPEPAAAAAPQPETKISLSMDALASLAAARPAAAPAPAKPPAAANPAASLKSTLHVATETAPIPAAVAAPAAPAPVAPVPTTAPAQRPAAPAIPLSLALQKLFDFLPQEVRVELADIDVPGATLGVPIQLVEAGLKSGRVMFTWNDLANWLQPPLLRPPSRSAGELLVELPLKVIAPAFMAHHRNGGAQKKADLDESIPDLFQSGNGQGDSGATVKPAPAPRMSSPATASAPSAASSPAPAPAAPAAAPAPFPARAAAASPLPGLNDVVGPQGQRYSPKQILQNVSRLPGVGGGLVAMADGLLVASALPAGAKSDTVAAFLPQMFGRMSQYTKELGLGALQSMVLHVEGGCWHVFKQPNIYFAVCGKGNEAMPLNLLTEIAAELSKQTV